MNQPLATDGSRNILVLGAGELGMPVLRNLARRAKGVAGARISVLLRAGTVVVNHQHFPHPPTDDGSREAIYARHALAAAFD